MGPANVFHALSPGDGGGPGGELRVNVDEDTSKRLDIVLIADGEVDRAVVVDAGTIVEIETALVTAFGVA